MLTWKTKQDFKTTMTGGFKIDRTGHVAGTWAIDYRQDDDLWMLTHVPTGLAAGAFPALYRARRFAEWLDALPISWTRIRGQQSAKFKPLGKAIVAKRNELGGQRP